MYAGKYEDQCSPFLSYIETAVPVHQEVFQRCLLFQQDIYDNWAISHSLTPSSLQPSTQVSVFPSYCYWCCGSHSQWYLGGHVMLGMETGASNCNKEKVLHLISSPTSSTIDGTCFSVKVFSLSSTSHTCICSSNEQKNLYLSLHLLFLGTNYAGSMYTPAEKKVFWVDSPP